MTTNLSAIAGPSRQAAELQPKVEPASPIEVVDNEVSVTKPGISVSESGEVVKVPAFLNKLYSMVSDLDTDPMIYWSESGDTFFVPDNVRFAQDILPRFFKHSNFSSFVRQLNMYGFHKVPHMQTGVLKNEAGELELWEFVNPFFKRDRPELLARVTRKNNRPVPVVPATNQGATGSRTSARQAASNTIGGVHLLTDGTTEGEAGPLVPTGSLADLHAIQTGINAIRQTQAAIGADLKALQTSNEHLWREAIESRERQQKHEETIDLIVSFLERLFGTEGEGLKGLKEAMRRGGLQRGGVNREDTTSEEPNTRKRRRLLIEDADKSDDNRFSEIQEPTVESASGSASRRSSVEPWASSGPRFTALPTDDEASPHPSKPLKAGNDPTLHPGGISPLSDVTELQGQDGNALQPYAGGTSEDMTGMNLDPSLLNTTIGSLLQSPAAAQMFFNSLNASVQGQALQHPKPAAPSPPLSGVDSDPTMALFSPLPSGLQSQNQDLISAYQKALNVNQDVGDLQDSIDSLVRSMGLDLPNGATPTATPATTATTAPSTAAPGTADGAFDDPNFNVDEFLDQLAKDGTDQ